MIDCSALGELKQRHRVKGNLTEELGNEQLAIDRTLPFLETVSLLYKL